MGGTHSLTLSARAEGERTEKDEIEKVKETGVRGSALPLRAGCGVCARGAPCRVLAGCRVPCGGRCGAAQAAGARRLYVRTRLAGNLAAAGARGERERSERMKISAGGFEGLSISCIMRPLRPHVRPLRPHTATKATHGH